LRVVFPTAAVGDRGAVVTGDLSEPCAWDETTLSARAFPAAAREAATDTTTRARFAQFLRFMVSWSFAYVGALGNSRCDEDDQPRPSTDE
jgi:hypothetical protein